MDRFLRGITACICAGVLLAGCNRQTDSASTAPTSASTTETRPAATAPPAAAPAPPEPTVEAPKPMAPAPEVARRASVATEARTAPAAIDRKKADVVASVDPRIPANLGTGSGIASRSARSERSAADGAGRAPAATASARASAPAKPARADRVDASPVIARPTLGSGVIRVPSTMKQGRDSIARLIVSPEDLATLLKDREVTRGDADVRETRENVHLTPRMRARLGGAGFSIEPKDFQDQAVKQGEPTVWVWTVVPEEAGNHTLVFTLEGLIMVGSKEVPIRPPALTVPVEVDVNPMYFVERHWQWLLTAIVLPVVGFLGKRWFDRRAVTPAPHG